MPLLATENHTYFCWLMMYGSLSTNALKGLRHLTTDTSCHRCGAAVESDIHTLHDSPSAIYI